MGILHISDEGISFSLTNSKSSRWYKVAWGDIFGAHQQTENRMIGFGTRLYISTSKGTIIFVYDGDLDLSSLIQQYITEHEAAESRRQETYQSLVRDHDFVSMSPDDFELFIKQLFSSMGYTVTRTGKSGDEGIDLVFEDSDQSLVIVQCKRYKNIISSSIIRDFFGAMQHVKAKKGYIITTSGFTKPAIEWSKGKPIVLIDKYELAKLVKEVEEP
jgi:predicted Mrr-cat superfamily restriction endonuclease